jgi:hypothetical protein
MKKWVNYFLFITIGIKKNTRNGKALSFIAEEIRAKIQRFKNRDKIGEIRRKFDCAAPSDYISTPSPAKLDNVRVFSLCHGGGTPEQKLSILSFLRHVGSPAKWTIVSDGSITESQSESLRAIHPSIEISDWSTFICEENKECYDIFSKYTLFAKKFVLESNLPVQGVTIYADSDILFFEGGHHFRNLLDNIGEKSYYQRDLPGYLDSFLLTTDELKAPPLNAGFVVQGKRLDWSAPIARLKAALSQLTPTQKIGDLEKLEQAITHAAHFLAGSEPLDEKYVLQISDRFDKEDPFAGPNFVMRHFVRPVRHKMWAHAADYLR